MTDETTDVVEESIYGDDLGGDAVEETVEEVKPEPKQETKTEEPETVQTEEDEPLPEWLTEPIQMSPPQQPQYPQHVYQQPQYQQQTPEQQRLTWEQAVTQNPEDVIGRVLENKLGSLQQQIVGPVASRLMQLDSFQKQQHDNNVMHSFNEARNAVASTLTTLRKKDPALKNKKVAAAFDFLTKRFVATGAIMAHEGGDFSGLQNAHKPEVMAAILASAKAFAQYPVGQTETVSYTGGSMEPSRSSQKDSGEYTSDEREAARQVAARTHGDVEAILKANREAEKMKKEWGWED